MTTPETVSNGAEDRDSDVEVEDLKATSQAATATIFTIGCSGSFSNTEA
ncbi:hypothetical protein [Streptomyces sp. NPDC001389]